MAAGDATAHAAIAAAPVPEGGDNSSLAFVIGGVADPSSSSAAAAPGVAAENSAQPQKRAMGGVLGPPPLEGARPAAASET